jgi:predicted phosphodiesterase
MRIISDHHVQRRSEAEFAELAKARYPDAQVVCLGDLINEEVCTVSGDLLQDFHAWWFAAYGEVIQILVTRNMQQYRDMWE